jgi:hypothetical protein
LRSVEAMKRKSASKRKQVYFGENSYEDVDKNEWLELDVGVLVKDKAFIQPTIS